MQAESGSGASLARQARRAEAAQARRTIARDAAVAAGTQLFGSRGFDGTTMADVSRESGVSLTALYEVFSSKEALFLEVIDGVFRKWMLPALQRNAPDADPGERILLLVDEILEIIEADRAYTMLSIRGDSGIPASMREAGRDPYAPYYGALKTRLVELISDAQAAGRAPGIPADTLASAVIATTLSLARDEIQSSSTRPITDVSGEIRSVFTPLLRSPRL